MSLKCSVPGCEEAVIGQCMGYNEPCGRFYCRKHSKGKICDECAIVQEADNLQKKYFSVANSLRPSVWPYVLLGMWGIPGIGLIGFIPFMNHFQNRDATFQDLPLLIFLLIFLVAIMIFSFYIPIKMFKRKEKYRLEDAKSNYPGIEGFYLEWKAQRRKEMLGAVAVIAIGAVLGGLFESNESSMERDIRHIKDRIYRL